MGHGRDAGENKYIPPNFDPRVLPKVKTGPKGRQTTTRIMMPMGVQCDGCGEWIARDKKFLSVKEKTGEKYLDEPIIRLKIRCPRCHGEIAICTDPKNRGYTVEYGAQRLYQHHLRQQEQEAEERAEREKQQGDQLAEHNQKVQQTQKEMSDLEQLEEMQYAQSARFAVSEEQLLRTTLSKHELKLQQDAEEEADRLEAERVFRNLAAEGKKQGNGHTAGAKRPRDEGEGVAAGQPAEQKRKKEEEEGAAEGQEVGAAGEAAVAAAGAVEAPLDLVIVKKEKKEKKKKRKKGESGGGLLAGYDSD